LPTAGKAAVVGTGGGSFMAALFGVCRFRMVLIRFYIREAASKASGERSHSSGSIDSWKQRELPFILSLA